MRGVGALGQARALAPLHSTRQIHAIPAQSPGFAPASGGRPDHISLDWRIL